MLGGTRINVSLNSITQILQFLFPSKNLMEIKTVNYLKLFCMSSVYIYHMLGNIDLVNVTFDLVGFLRTKLTQLSWLRFLFFG